MGMLGKWLGFGIEELYEQAKLAYDGRDWASAIDRFETCLETSGDADMRRLSQLHLADAHAQLGKKFMREKEYFGAIKNLKAAIKVSPGFPDLYIALARAYEEVGDDQLSEETIDQALALNPKYVDAIFEQGLVWYKRGRRPEGLYRAFQAVQLDPSFGSDAFAEARRADRDGDTVRAVQALRVTRRLDEEPTNIHTLLGNSFLRDRLYAEAEQEFQQAVLDAPDYPDLHCKLGQSQVELGRLSQGLAQIDHSIELNPRYIEAYVWRGIACERLGMLRDAASAFEKALELDPYNQTALVEIGKLRFAS